MRPLTFRSIALFILQALIFVLVQAGYGVAGSVTTTGVIKPLAVENAQAIKYGGGEGTDTSGAEAGASNINLKGATVVALGDVSLIAGNNINVLDQLTESHEFEAEYKKTSGFLSKKTSTSQSITDTVATVGSQVSGKNVLLQAGQVGEDGKLVSGSGDIKIQGSDISASDKVTLNAGRDILIVPGQGTLQESHEETRKRSGLSASFMDGISVGTSSSKGTGTSSQTINVGSRIQGGDIQMQAGRDATIQASQVIADRDIDVKAGRNINITAARDIQNSDYASSSRSTGVGLMPGLSASFTVFGQNSTEQNGKDRLGVGTTSVLSANAGTLTLRAGTDEQYKGTGQGNVTTQGADLLAKERVSISGNAVDLQAVETTHESEDHLRSKSLVVGARPAGMLGAVINTADAALQSARSGSNRLAGANALKAGYDAYKYSLNGATSERDAARAVFDKGGDDKAISPDATRYGVSVSISASETRQDSSQSSTTQRGTNIQASNIDITANEGDITMHGAKLQAENIALDAAKNIHLLAIQNTQQVQSSSSSSGGGLGVTVALGEQSGVSFQANYGQSRNRANGTETVHDNTQIIAGNRLSIKSGGDTELRGAQVAGKQVSVDVGGNLVIETLQDKTTYDMQQSSSGFNISLCIPPICYGNPVTGSVNVSRTELNHNYQSAVGQSGISAGEGGYDIKVAGNTHLTGGAITSTAEPDKNQLQTQSLTFSDLTNTQDTHVSTSSIGLAYGSGSALSTLAANAASNLLAGTAAQAGLPEAGSDRSQTQSVISPGKVTITGQDADGSNAQAVATLTQRDPETADQGLTNRLTLVQAQQIEANQREAQENLLIANQVGSVLTGAVGDISAGKWEDGAPEKVALHAMVGAAVVALGGGNAGVGLLTGAANELAVGVMRDYLVDLGYVPGTPEFNEMMKLGSAVLGTVISRTAGGDAQTTAASGQLARDATEHNFLSHPQWDQYAKELADCRAKGCSKEEEAQIRSQWQETSDKQNLALANCKATNNCAELESQVTQGTERMELLLREGKIPGGAVQNDLSQYLGQTLVNNPERREDVNNARIAVENCNANPAQCDKQAMTAAALVLAPLLAPITSGSTFAASLLSGGRMLATEVTLWRNLGTVGYCAIRPQGCVVIIETAAGIATNSSAPTVLPVGKVPGPKKPASSPNAAIGLRNDLSMQAGIPTSNSDIWGSSLDDLKQAFNTGGATIKPGQARSSSSGNAQIFKVEGSNTGVVQVQYSPESGLSQHKGQYYKFTFADGTDLKIIDPNTYVVSGWPERGGKTKFQDPSGKMITYNPASRTWR